MVLVYQMSSKNSPGLTAILLIFAVFLGFSLFVNLPSVHQGFLFADQAIYYSMTQSLAQDGDLEYTKKDLIRYYEEFPSGPLGIFLKKVQEGRLFYAKSFAYPLFAAPFVKLFGANGALVFHSLLLLLLLLMGHAYFSVSNPSSLSLITVVRGSIKLIMLLLRFQSKFLCLRRFRSLGCSILDT